MKREGAFTLVELVVVIILLGMLVALSHKGIRYYHNISHRVALEQAGHWLEHVYQMAKNTCTLQLNHRDTLWVASIDHACQVSLQLREPIEYSFSPKYPLTLSPQLPLRVSRFGFEDNQHNSIKSLEIKDKALSWFIRVHSGRVEYHDG